MVNKVLAACYLFDIQNGTHWKQKCWMLAILLIVDNGHLITLRDILGIQCQTEQQTNEVFAFNC